MKKIIITALIALLPLTTFAQTEFDKFEDKDGIDGVVISENLVNLLGYIKISEGSGAEKAQEYLKKVRDVESLRVFSTADRQYCNDMKSTVKSYLRKHKMEEFASVNSKNNKMKMYMITGDNTTHIKEFLLFSENEKENKAVLVSFIGNIDLDAEEKS